MKTGILFTGTGPLLIITSYDSFNHPLLILNLAAKGINRYIAYDLPEELVREKYGAHFELVMQDLHQKDDLRVLDYDGHRLFERFPMSIFSEQKPFYHEPT